MPLARFTSKMIQKLHLGTEEEILCKSCEGNTGKRKAAEVEKVCICRERHLNGEFHFHCPIRLSRTFAQLASASVRVV